MRGGMGRRARKDGDESDAFDRAPLQVFRKPGVRKIAKRRANRRERRQAKQERTD